MKINGHKITGDKFAWDRCHKIYIIEDEQDEIKALDIGYNLYPIDLIQDCYENSCPLRFISNWKLDKHIVNQFEDEEHTIIFEK